MAEKDTSLAPMPEALAASVLAPSSYGTEPSPTQTQPATVPIGGREVPVSEIETRLQRAQQLETQNQEMADSFALHQTLMKLPYEERHLVLDKLDEVVKARETGMSLRNVEINQFDPRDDFEPQKQSEMTDGELTVLGLHFDLKTDVEHAKREIFAYVEKQAAMINYLVSRFDVMDLKAELGLTDQEIAWARGTGATDLRTFFKGIKRDKKAQSEMTALETQAEPPLGAPATDGREFDFKTATFEQQVEAWKKGLKPKDPVYRQMLIDNGIENLAK